MHLAFVIKSIVGRSYINLDSMFSFMKKNQNKFLDFFEISSYFNHKPKKNDPHDNMKFKQYNTINFMEVMFWGYTTKDSILIFFSFCSFPKAWSKIKYICIYDNQIIL